MSASNATGAAFNAARAGAAQVGALRPTIVVAGNNATGAAFNAARAGAAAVGALRPTIAVAGNNATGAAFNAARSGAAALGSLRPTITVAGNNATGPAFNAARASATQLGAMRPMIVVGGDAAPWARVAAASGNVALALGRLRPTITVTGVNATGPGFAAATAGATAVGRLRPTITVTGTNATGPAFAGAIAGATAIGRLRPTITVTANTAGAMAQETAFAGYTTALMVGVQGAVAAITGKWILMAAAIALLLPAITPVLGGVLTLGAAATALAGGLGLIAGAAYVLVNSSFPATEAAFTHLKDRWEELRQSLLKNEGFNQAALTLAHLGDLAIGIAQNQIPMLGAAADKTMDAIRTSINSVIARMGDSMSDSFSTIVKAIPGIMGNITTAVAGLSGGLLAMLATATPMAGQFAGWIADTATAFFDWANSEAGRQQVLAVITSIVPVAQALWQALVAIVPPLIQIGIDYGPMVAQTIKDIADIIVVAISVVTTVVGWIQTLVDWLNWTAEASGNAGAAIGGYINGVVQQTGGIPAAIDNALANVVSLIEAPFINAWNSLSAYLGTWASALYTYGVNFIVGLINGIVAQAQALYNSVATIGSNVLTSMKNALGIASPSRPAMEFGENVGAALAMGLLSQVAQIRTAANALASAAVPQVVGGTIPIWRAGTTNATVLGGGAGPITNVPAMPLLAPSTGLGGVPGPGGTSTLEERLAALESLMAQQNALLANGIRLDADSTGRIGNEAAGGLSNRLRNDMWTRQDAIAGQAKSLESAKFGGLLR